MSVLKVLRQKVAAELNALFTSPPSQAVGGWDGGWQGHAHAFHAFLVARMFGAAADLRSGDVAVLSRFVPPLTTLEREAKHAWCSINGVVPVDLSLTFAYFENVPQLRSAVTGEGPNGDWQVRYATDDAILDESFESGNEILYIERQVHIFPVGALLDNPSAFLPPAPAGQDWAGIHGPDIQAQIALHCFRHAAGETRSVRNCASREAALQWIAANYPDARAEILAQIET